MYRIMLPNTKNVYPKFMPIFHTQELASEESTLYRASSFTVLSSA